jgi:hypothetical protein
MKVSKQNVFPNQTQTFESCVFSRCVPSGFIIAYITLTLVDITVANIRIFFIHTNTNLALSP